MAAEGIRVRAEPEVPADVEAEEGDGDRSKPRPRATLRLFAHAAIVAGRARRRNAVLALGKLARHQRFVRAGTAQDASGRSVPLSSSIREPQLSAGSSMAAGKLTCKWPDGSRSTRAMDHGCANFW